MKNLYLVRSSLYARDCFVEAKSPEDAVNVAIKDISLDLQPEVYLARFIKGVLRPVGKVVYEFSVQSMFDKAAREVGMTPIRLNSANALTPKKRRKQ